MWLTRSLRALLREPLLQFLLLGLLIFAVAEWRARRADAAAHTITVDAGTLHYLATLYNVQYGVDPDAATLDFLVANHVREQVLLREAAKLGLAQDDEIISRRLVQKMEYLLEDGKALPVADADTLQSWYQQHQQNYQKSAQATFTHVYFSPDTGGDVAAQRRAQSALVKIASSAVAGDRFPIESDYHNLDAASVRQLFGDSELAKAVFTAPVGIWQGPLRSGLGWHLLKVEQRSEAGVQPFAAVAEQVRDDWLEQQRKQRADDDFKQLLSQYKVVRTQ
ncbi:MAG TPA: peptidylprolyl isomerase [Candidatus Acidoferrum sp.]|nr:peptidylprolyl isomerase [Candidatus Acidoferrum sp.]